MVFLPGGADCQHPGRYIIAIVLLDVHGRQSSGQVKLGELYRTQDCLLLGKDYML